VTADLAERLRAARQRIDREAGAAQQLALTGQRAENEAAIIRGQIELYTRVTALFTSIGEERQETARQQIEGLVTRGLQVIFGTEYSFHLVTSERSHQSQVDFIIRSQYGERTVDTPVLEARGGGMAVVVAFMLRLVVLLLTPGARRLLVLDESFAHVSRGYEPRVAEFLREVCDQAGMQIILITHSDAYSDLADQRYQLELAPGGVTALAGLQREDLS
jgi:DNA repair exonuclease SbcCD ATPase subunit